MKRLELRQQPHHVNPRIYEVRGLTLRALRSVKKRRKLEYLFIEAQ